MPKRSWKQKVILRKSSPSRPPKDPESAKPKIVFIVGPTASGKTQVGLELGQKVAAEFISADSMQIYKGMDIVTDKLPEKLRLRYKYHLVDFVPAAKEFNVASFCRKAAAEIKKIIGRGKLPVVVGGTGLYVNSLLYGIFEAGKKDDGIRGKIKAEIEKEGLPKIYEMLKGLDPQAAAKINPNDARRIVRALEVHASTGKPISELQKERRGLARDYQVFLFGLRRDRQDLYRRIDQRVDFMVNAGLLDEVRKLLRRKLSPTASCCIGIREMEGFLKGRYDLEEAVRLMKRNSRRFAKRQMTWFNKNKEITWIDAGTDESIEHVAEVIIERVKG